MSSRRQRSTKRYLIAGGFLLCMLALVGCGIQTAEPSRPRLSVQQTMSWVLDPAADVVWDNAGVVITEAGEQALAPTTDEGWDKVRNHAAIVMQTGSVLSAAGSADDASSWREYADGLVDAGAEAMHAAQHHDAQRLFDAGGRIYAVCSACHQHFIPR